MILIDKQSDYHQIIVTVTELSSIESPFYLMVIHSDFTNKTYRIKLPDNNSPHKGRYDLFIVENAVFNDIEEGIYNYSIYESGNETENEQILGTPVEKGFLKVAGSPLNSYASVQPDEGEDDFIVYDPLN